MARKKHVWKNPKHGGTYTGYYVRDADGERTFQLKRDTSKGGKAHRITLESHEAAKVSGWRHA